MWQDGPSPGADVAGREPSPGADAPSAVPAQMWVAPSLFQSWCRCGRMAPVTARTWETANPVPVPTWRRHGDAAYELRHVVEHVSGVVRLRSTGRNRWHAPASPRCAAECVQAGARRMKQRSAPTGCRSSRARGEGMPRWTRPRRLRARARACAPSGGRAAAVCLSRRPRAPSTSRSARVQARPIPLRPNPLRPDPT